MITIERIDKTKVAIKFESGPLNYIFSFTYQCNDDVHAQLLRDDLDGRLRRRIELIRKEEYNKGYKDGRAKRGKVSLFHSWLKTNVY